MVNHVKKPDWLKIDFRSNDQFANVNQIVKEHCLHTICTSGRCPNMTECWSRGTATFMILGDICTRSCKFCNTQTGRPLPPNPNEPQQLAESIKLMKLKLVAHQQLLLKKKNQLRLKLQQLLQQAVFNIMLRHQVI